MRSFHRAGVLAVLIALASWGTTGCSPLLVKPAPHYELRDLQPMALDCTESTLAPVLDAGLGTILGLTAVGLLVGSYRPQTSTVEAGASLPGAISLGFIGSAIYGFGETARCQKALKDFAAVNNDFLAGRLRRSSPAGPAPSPGSMDQPSIRPGCTDTPEFRAASPIEKKRILEECRRETAARQPPKGPPPAATPPPDSPSDVPTVRPRPDLPPPL